LDDFHRSLFFLWFTNPIVSGIMLQEIPSVEIRMFIILFFSKEQANIIEKTISSLQSVFV